MLKCSKERSNLLSEEKSFSLHKNYGLVKCSYGKSLLQEFQLKHKTMEDKHPINNVCVRRTSIGSGKKTSAQDGRTTCYGSSFGSAEDG